MNGNLKFIRVKQGLWRAGKYEIAGPIGGYWYLWLSGDDGVRGADEVFYTKRDAVAHAENNNRRKIAA